MFFAGVYHLLYQNNLEIAFSPLVSHGRLRVVLVMRNLLGFGTDLRRLHYLSCS
jgi:hypothetical protein